VREHCLSPNRLFDSGELRSARLKRRSAGNRTKCGEATGCDFFWLLFFAQAKKSNPPAAREPHLSC
jgi:hypothetical protein